MTNRSLFPLRLNLKAGHRFLPVSKHVQIIINCVLKATKSKSASIINNLSFENKFNLIVNDPKQLLNQTLVYSAILS